MGLFTNNKKLCPICGNPTLRLLATKVEDVPLCKECASKIDLPDGALDQMTLDQLGKYMDFYAENEALQQTFKESYRFGFGLLSGALLMDGEHRLLRLKPYDRSLVFEASALKSFRITEDTDPLFVGKEDGLLCYRSDVPHRAAELAPSIDSFLRRKQEFEHMEDMRRMMERDRDDRNHDRMPPRPPRPTFECTPPVRKFRIELTLEHPYWRSFREEISAPDFSSQYPSVDDYLREYDDKVNELHELAAQRLLRRPPLRIPWRRSRSISFCLTPVSSPRKSLQPRKSSFWAFDGRNIYEQKDRGAAPFPCDDLLPVGLRQRG